MKFADVEIEQALLGRMLHSEPRALSELDFNEDDFSETFHWWLYQEILTGKQLKEFALNKTEDYDYIKSLSDVWSMPLTGDEGYSKILKELSRKRKINSVLRDCLDSIEEQESSEILGILNNTLNEHTDAPNLKTRKEVRQEILSSLELPKACYPTPYRNLNTAMGGGLYEGFTYGFCGAEKAGKTTIAHSISHMLDCPHLYIAMEMGAKQIEERNLAKDLQINSLKFLEAGDGLKNKVETAPQKDNVIYYDAPGADLNEIQRYIGMAKIKYGIKGFILDYWQLVGGQQRGESEEKHLRHVAQSLANYARKNKVWCILLAQMNKDGQLFGGNGLRKACDQLYMIEQCEHSDYGRWLRMDASRYTFKADVGSDHSPSLTLNVKSGPCFEELV